MITNIRVQSTKTLEAYSNDNLTNGILLKIIKFLESKEIEKVRTLCNFYNSKILAEKIFYWIDTNNNKEYKNANLLLVSCIVGDCSLLKNLLATNIVEIDQFYGEDNTTLLMLAAQNSDTKILSLLLSNGANWRLTDANNNRADQLQLANCKSATNLNLCRENISLFLDVANQTNENTTLATGKNKFEVTDHNYLEIKYFNQNNNFIICYFTTHVYKDAESEYNDHFEHAVTNKKDLSEHISKIKLIRKHHPKEFLECLDNDLLEELDEDVDEYKDIPQYILDSSLTDFYKHEKTTEEDNNYTKYILNIMLYRACIEIPMLAVAKNQEAIIELARIKKGLYYLTRPYTRGR